MPALTTRGLPVGYLLDVCSNLGLDITIQELSPSQLSGTIFGPSGESIGIDFSGSGASLIEQVLQGIQIEFSRLPLLVRGDSKEIRRLTPKICVTKLLPTVYSFTHNRYGVAPGTDHIRARFAGNLFREMAAFPGSLHLPTAFLALLETTEGPLLCEEIVQTCNLEVRVKRFHIGSPIHRYKYYDQHRTAHNGPPLSRWSRFVEPKVCFDWRHPMQDEEGNRLADEPLPDDYAAIWIDDLAHAKDLARRTFEWIERRFEHVGLQLIDICFFIDRHGKVIFGEISPDCMRVRSKESVDSEALDKDVWRNGGAPENVLSRYERLYEIVFGASSSKTGSKRCQTTRTPLDRRPK